MENRGEFEGMPTKYLTFNFFWLRNNFNNELKQ